MSCHTSMWFIFWYSQWVLPNIIEVTVKSMITSSQCKKLPSVLFRLVMRYLLLRTSTSYICCACMNTDMFFNRQYFTPSLQSTRKWLFARYQLYIFRPKFCLIMQNWKHVCVFEHIQRQGRGVRNEEIESTYRWATFVTVTYFYHWS